VEIQTQIPIATRATNPLLSLVRAAFEKLSRPALWKRRRQLRVCETLSLGNRNFVAVIGYQQRRFLVAGTPTTISLLADVTSESLQNLEDLGEDAGERE
jgi:flagellar biogenesis protein FliO